MIFVDLSVTTTYPQSLVVLSWHDANSIGVRWPLWLLNQLLYWSDVMPPLSEISWRRLYWNLPLEKLNSNVCIEPYRVHGGKVRKSTVIPILLSSCKLVFWCKRIPFDRPQTETSLWVQTRDIWLERRGGTAPCICQYSNSSHWQLPWLFHTNLERRHQQLN